MRLLELMCITNFLVRLHNLFGVENVKQENTWLGPAQAFMNNERFLREEAVKLATKEREEEQHWIAKLVGKSLSSGTSTTTPSPTSREHCFSPLSQSLSGALSPRSIRLARPKLDTS